MRTKGSCFFLILLIVSASFAIWPPVKGFNNDNVQFVASFQAGCTIAFASDIVCTPGDSYPVQADNVVVVGISHALGTVTSVTDQFDSAFSKYKADASNTLEIWAARMMTTVVNDTYFVEIKTSVGTSIQASFAVYNNVNPLTAQATNTTSGGSTPARIEQTTTRSGWIVAAYSFLAATTATINQGILRSNPNPASGGFAMTDNNDTINGHVFNSINLNPSGSWKAVSIELLPDPPLGSTPVLDSILSGQPCSVSPCSLGSVHAGSSGEWMFVFLTNLEVDNTTVSQVLTNSKGANFTLYTRFRGALYCQGGSWDNAIYYNTNAYTGASNTLKFTAHSPTSIAYFSLSGVSGFDTSTVISNYSDNGFANLDGQHPCTHAPFIVKTMTTNAFLFATDDAEVTSDPIADSTWTSLLHGPSNGGSWGRAIEYKTGLVSQKVNFTDNTAGNCGGITFCNGLLGGASVCGLPTCLIGIKAQTLNTAYVIISMVTIGGLVMGVVFINDMMNKPEHLAENTKRNITALILIVVLVVIIGALSLFFAG